MCVVGGHIYAVGGRDYSSELDSVERYDPKTNTWEFVAPLKNEVRLRVKSVCWLSKVAKVQFLVLVQNHLEPSKIIRVFSSKNH